MKSKISYIISEKTPFYETGPQQGRPPDGMLKAGERVGLVKKDSSYPQIELENGKVVYVATESLMDRIVLFRDMNFDEATELLKKLPEKHRPLGHKFVLRNESEMIISVTGEGNPKHKILGEVEKPLTAGYVDFATSGDGKAAEIDFYNTSRDYCPKFESLEEAKEFIQGLLEPLKIEPSKIKKNNKPNFYCIATHAVAAETHFYKSGPQQSAPPDDTLKVDDLVRVIEKDSSYPRVELENKKTGYVAAADLKIHKRK